MNPPSPTAQNRYRVIQRQTGPVTLPLNLVPRNPSVSRARIFEENVAPRNYTIQPIIWPTNIQPIRQPLPYLDYPISPIGPISSEDQLPHITILSPRNNKVKIIGSIDRNEIDKLTEMVDQSGSKETDVSIVIGSPPPSPVIEPLGLQHECQICFSENISSKDLLKCCNQPMCSTCIGRLGNPACPFCRGPLEGVKTEVVEKIEKVHQQELIKNRMNENFFDKLGAEITKLAMIISRQGESQAILQLFTSVAALKYDNTIPQTYQERQALIRIIIQKLTPFNVVGAPNHMIEVDIGSVIIAVTSEAQEEEAIRQSKELAENETFFKDLSSLIMNFALQLENISTQPNQSKMKQLQNQIRSFGKTTTVASISGNKIRRDALVDQIYSKLSIFNRINMSEKLVKDKISKLVQLQISIASK